MTKPHSHLRPSDIRGIAQLATQATTGVTRIAEGVHQSVWDTMGVPGGNVRGQTGGITGLVYKTVRGMTLLVGTSVDSAFGLLQTIFGNDDESKTGSPRRETVLAALNGVIGDHLATTNNPLMTAMTLRYSGEALNWKALLSMPEASGKVLLLIHGLCMNDLQWNRHLEGEVIGHGETLARTLGYTPVYVRYNSGLHTSHNGRELSTQLEQLVTRWPTVIEELTVVAHSMGGLLIRSAAHYAEKESLSWPSYLKNIVFLGTPHHGAPMEQAGNWVDTILAGTRYTKPFARLGQVRSAGITDLRHGHVVDEDWEGRDRFQRMPDSRKLVPLPKGVNCYTIAATTATRRGGVADRLVGDGLVPLNSALGRSRDERRILDFPEASQHIEYGMNHVQLLTSPEVTDRIVRWLAPTRPARKVPETKGVVVAMEPTEMGPTVASIHDDTCGNVVQIHEREDDV